MKLNEQIKLAAEHYASFGGDEMDGAAYFAFIKGAEYALKLIDNEIKNKVVLNGYLLNYGTHQKTK